MLQSPLHLRSHTAIPMSRVRGALLSTIGKGAAFARNTLSAAGKGAFVRNALSAAGKIASATRYAASPQVILQGNGAL